MTDFGLASVARRLDSILVTQVQGYSIAWAAPEILEKGDRSTQEGDIFAFGMVGIEVGPHVSPHLGSGPGEWIVYLASNPYFRSLQEGPHLAGAVP